MSSRELRKCICHRDVVIEGFVVRPQSKDGYLGFGPGLYEPGFDEHQAFWAAVKRGLVHITVPAVSRVAEYCHDVFRHDVLGVELLQRAASARQIRDSLEAEHELKYDILRVYAECPQSRETWDIEGFARDGFVLLGYEIVVAGNFRDSMNRALFDGIDCVKHARRWASKLNGGGLFRSRPDAIEAWEAFASEDSRFVNGDYAIWSLFMVADESRTVED